MFSCIAFEVNVAPVTASTSWTVPFFTFIPSYLVSISFFTLALYLGPSWFFNTTTFTITQETLEPRIAEAKDLVSRIKNYLEETPYKDSYDIILKEDDEIPYGNSWFLDWFFLQLLKLFYCLWKGMAARKHWYDWGNLRISLNLLSSYSAPRLLQRLVWKRVVRG